MKKTTIDAGLLPHMWLTWSTTKGDFWLDCSTGEKYDYFPNTSGRYDPNVAIIKSGSKPRYGYAKYHKDIDMLELAEVTIDTTRKGEPKEWKYSGEKYFVKHDKDILDEYGDIRTNRFTLSQYHSSYDFKGFLGFFYRIGYYKNVEEFKKFLGSDTYTVGSGRVVDVSQVWHIQEWYKTKQKIRGAGKQQKLTDELTSMPLSDVSGLCDKYPVITVQDRWYTSSVDGIIYFERINDEWSVLRVFKRDCNNEPIEKERMYLHDNGTNRIVAPGKEGWIPTKLKNEWSYYRFVNEEEASEKCNRIKYILPMIKDVAPSYIKYALVTILRFPELEQMANLGYATDATHIAKSKTPAADLKNLFGGYYNGKEKTFLRKAGMTKRQFDHYMLKYSDQSNYDSSKRKIRAALTEMRKIFGNDLTPIDDNTFQKYLHGLSKMQFGWRGQIYPQLENFNIDRNKFIKNAIRLSEKHPNVYQLLDDTLNSYYRINRNTRPEVNWYFDNYSDIVRTHDVLDDLRRVQEAEQRAMYNMAEAERRKKEEEKRAKIDEERKQYEYEDDDYVIRLPNDLNEIVREGDRQHICIGGYTSRHAFGDTNLFFLRKKNEPTIPFYAIEMNNEKRIVQIHGFGNAWLGNNPEAIPTVVRWLRKNGIRCDEKILTCTSRGYCSTNNYVVMPVVD